MRSQLSLRIGALLGGLGVGLGAFGAHGLKAHLTEADLAIWDTAVRYLLWHALALCLCAVLEGGGAGIRLAGLAFVAGCVLFSGSLLLLALTGQRWLGAVTPFGGVCLLVGWGALALWGRRDLLAAPTTPA
jgi:uncharacterized membrane protein YgdD (TMEM256/DUF423 family)